MKSRTASILIFLVVLAVVVGLPVSAAAEPSPYVLTDTPLYTLRDKQVLLLGGGFDPVATYAVWLQGPADNSTLFTGVSFVTTENGELPSIPPATTPPAVWLPIQETSLPGTYLVSISNSTTSDSAIAQAHYGTWGTDKSVYQRTEVIQIKGGGVLPKTSLDMMIRNPSGVSVHGATIATDRSGSFNATWKISADGMTGAYAVFIDGVGTYDRPSAEFVSTSKFSATPALLNVVVASEPEGSFERTRVVSVEFAVLYPDSSPVVTMKEGLKPVALYAGEFKRADLAPIASDPTSGLWIAERKIARDAPLNVKHRFVMPANAFDDGNGNIGPEKDVQTSGFDVVSATLQVSTSLNSTRYQIPFDTVVAYIHVKYPDGTSVTNATVRGWLAAADSRTNASMTYDGAAEVWIAKYGFSLGDLFKPGTWVLSVEATDVYGNAGSASLEVVAEPYNFLAVLLLVVIALFLARWLMSKYWRRLYLRTKRISGAVRERWRPHSVGRRLTGPSVAPD